MKESWFDNNFDKCLWNKYLRIYQPLKKIGKCRSNSGYLNDEHRQAGVNISFTEHCSETVRNSLMVLDRIIEKVNVECCMQERQPCLHFLSSTLVHV